MKTNTQSMKKFFLENPITISIIIGIIYFGTFGFLKVYSFVDWEYGPFIQSVLAVFLGAGAIGIITGVIIMFQAALESKKEKAKEIFDQKINLYKKLIDDVSGMFEDGKISESEFRRIELLMLKLQLMAQDETVSTFADFYKKIAEMILDDDESKEMEVEVDIQLKNLFSNFVNQCRIDLELADQKLDENIFSEIKAVQKRADDSIVSKRFKSPKGKIAADLVYEYAKKLSEKGVSIQTAKVLKIEIEKKYPLLAIQTIRSVMSAHSSKDHPTNGKIKGHNKRSSKYRDDKGQELSEYDWWDYNKNNNKEYTFIG